MKKISKYLIVACVAIGTKGFSQINVPQVPNTTITFDHPFLDASEYSDSTPNNQNKGLYFPSTDLTKWTFKTNNLDGITFPTAFNGMVVYNIGSGSTLADASKAGQTVTVKPGFYYFYNPNNAEGTSIANGYWKAFNAGDIPPQPWYDAATQTQATDNTQNIYQMGRVGVYTKKPNATLQMEASGKADEPDGLLIPRILLSDLQTKDNAYDVAQNATLIYVINDLGNQGPVGPPGGGVGGVGPGGPASKVDYVLESGFYYYDANDLLWKALETRATNGLTQTSYNNVKLGGQLSENTTLSGTKTLTVATPLKITSGTPGAGKVLTSDTTGNASWTTLNNSWNLNGNTLTSTDFIGSTNNVDIVFKRNNNIVGVLGQDNLAFGFKALTKITTGAFNIALGRNALENNTTGFENISIGINALNSNTTGYNNLALGAHALFSSTTGFNNIALGQFALKNNTEGHYNIGIGGGALKENTKGFANTALGSSALENNIIGKYNVAIGTLALQANESGSNNVAVGQAALGKKTIGDNNVAIGFAGLENFELGEFNIALGSRSLGSLTSGDHNIGIGNYALIGMNRGNSNLGIGNYTKIDNDLIGATVVGQNAQATQSYSLILGAKRGVNGMTDPSTKVGIGTTAPVATLQIEADATDTTRADGLLLPRMSLEVLKAKDAAYGPSHDGMLVFVTNTTGTTTYKTKNVKSKGLYYYDASYGFWIPFCTCEPSIPVV